MMSFVLNNDDFNANVQTKDNQIGFSAEQWPGIFGHNGTERSGGSLRLQDALR